MITVAIEEMAGSDRVLDPDDSKASPRLESATIQSEMALFYECRE
jgi:hypothetical protein